MKREVFYVSSEKQITKKHSESRIVGFVFVSGWEKPLDKATAKYPGFSNYKVHRKGGW